MEDYYKQRDSERERIYKMDKRDVDYKNSYLLASANLYNLMPQIPVSDHEDLIKNVLFHQSLAWIEQSNINVLERCNISGSEIISSVLPAIFCSFHLGSYRLNLSYLLRRGIPIALVASSNVIREQGRQIADNFRKLTGKEECVIINSESATSLLQMTRELKSGRSLFVYIDGNSGVGGVRRNDPSLVKISFLNKPIFARKGVAFLSHFAGIPIIPIFAYRRAMDDIHIKVFSPIEPQSGDRLRYCEDTTRLLYDNFSSWLLKYPEQWEAWFYMHKYIDIRSISCITDSKDSFEKKQRVGKFNSDRYGFFSVRRDLYLFDRYTYRSYAIDSSMYALLQDEEGLNTIDKEIYLEFIEMDIIN